MWIAIVSLGVAGCAKQVPVSGLEYSPEDKVVLTFQDGSTVVGRMDVGETVIYRKGDASFRASVAVVDETEIELADLVPMEDGTLRYQQERQSSFRLYVDDELQDDRLLLRRDDVLQVEQVVTDKGRTLRRILFWSFGGGVAMLAARDRNF
jgi:hypothetical protein